jgi:peptide/nickel transport system substrate-binding protein
LRVNLSGSDVQTLDPALAFDVYGGQLVLATCARLVTYAERPGQAGTRLVPEVATALPRVSDGGRAYTFTLRRSFRFNTGERVTARSFERAFTRALHPRMPSAAIAFMGDIVGAQAFKAGRARAISGIRARGDTLTVRLTAPSPTFVYRAAMTFFCAVPAALPVAARGVALPPGAGPFYFARREPGRLIVLRRNPHYGGSRPRRLDSIVVYTGVEPNQSILQVERGQRDYDLLGVPAAANARLARQHGVNRRGGRYRVNALIEVDYLALNTRRGPFRNARLRRAVNLAVDRTGLTAQIGPYAGRPADQILPPTMPGFRPATVYPLRPNVARARELAGGVRADVTLYYPADPTADNQVQIIRRDLARIGLNVKLKRSPFNAFLEQVGNPRTPYDMVLFGFQADFPDPSDFLNLLLAGSSITPQNNPNVALFDSPTFNRKLAAAARLTGSRRLETYGRLDVEIMREAAPWVPISNRTQREFISARVGCYTPWGAYGFMSLATACLKR